MFTTEQFENIVPWLMLNRQGLDVLVHPLTDNSYDDHSRYAVWLGSPVPFEAQPGEPHLPPRAISDALNAPCRLGLKLFSIALLRCIPDGPPCAERRPARLDFRAAAGRGAKALAGAGEIGTRHETE
jgi:hypothetical protein